VPFGVKELIAVAGFPQGYGTTAMPRLAAVEDAHCVRRLRAAGAIPVGMTRTSELAWRDDTPPTLNPLDPALSCGGSSGGSGVAVAAGLVPFALGTDTGGSVRVPAALCGCCGHKPTFNLVPTTGVLPVSPSLDHVGVLAASVQDVRLVLDVFSDARVTRAGDAGSMALRIGVSLGLTECDWLLEGLRRSDAELVPVEMSSLAAGYNVVNTVSLVEGARIFEAALAAPADALSVVSRSELALAVSLDAKVLSDALRMGETIRAEMDALFAREELDAIVLEALSGPAPRRDRPAAQLNWPLPLANVTGQPSCVVPVRRRPLPVAVQILGRRGEDERVLNVAATIEALAQVA